jgi:glycyl-tRNA synthetase beta chain
MRDHQKYFAVEDSNGKLAPHFLTVTNIALDAENAATIRQGNERVLRARFNDARFFWEFDQRTPLADRVKLLENVTFQKDLGSYAAKSERVSAIAKRLITFAAARGATLNESAIAEAARLAKTDLTTELVKEFTELQGIIGGLYAHSQGLSAVVADAIYDQYLPASAKDSIPRSPEGCLLGLADRIDTIAGMFRLGMEPTGSKDPFALRRAANAIVRLLAESSLPLLLSDIINASTPAKETTEKLHAFFLERIGFYLRESRDQAYDVAKAVMAAGANDIRDLVARAEAVTAVRGGEDFIVVCAAFKRMKNILVQAQFNRADLTDDMTGRVGDVAPQIALATKSFDVAARMHTLREQRNYLGAIEQIATMRPEVDAFFESVMVNDPDEGIRKRRLALLAMIVSNFSSIADFSEIVTAG